jgi:hypothetical protein
MLDGERPAAPVLMLFIAAQNPPVTQPRVEFDGERTRSCCGRARVLRCRFRQAKVTARSARPTRLVPRVNERLETTRDACGLDDLRAP